VNQLPEVRPEIAAFLADHHAAAEDQVVWANGTLPLQSTLYLSESVPPLDVLLSVRCLVFDGDTVLVMRDIDEQHILPGGRREAGESLEETVRRELLEESGFALGTLHPLGFVHLHRLAPIPEGDVYPHPDFFWLIRYAECGAYLPDARVDDPQQIEIEWMPIEAAMKLPLRYGQAVMLNAAAQARRAID
jgi:ADP-ribose pyrophosphatase YjhB (NUDIX family)